MQEDLNTRIKDYGSQLHERSRALSHRGKDEDLALIMESLAVTMEAVRSIGKTVSRLDGPSGLGAEGD